MRARSANPEYGRVVRPPGAHLNSRGCATAQTEPRMLDRDIRQALRERLVAEHGSEALIVDELALREGSVRADLCLVNGALSGFEIKSAADSLGRLPAQVAGYSRVFDYAALVADARHLEQAGDQLPDWWGVYEARRGRKGPRIVRIRRGRRNPALDVASVVQLLWRDEALAVLEQHGIADGLSRCTRSQLWQLLVDEVPASQLCAAVREALKARGDWRVSHEPAKVPEPWWRSLVDASAS